MFINLFEKRSFGERYDAVFSFAKQNFLSVVKLYFPIFLLTSVVFFISKQIDSVLLFVNCAYMALYIKHKDESSFMSFKDSYNYLGRSFLIFLELIGPYLLYFLLPMVVAIIICGVLNFFSTVLAVLFFMVFIIFWRMITILYNIHYYFSYKEYKGSFILLKEVFCLLKGHWLNSILFFLFFNFISLIMLLPFVFADKFLLQNDILVYLFFPLICFFVSDNATMFLYGHLKALQQEKVE